MIILYQVKQSGNQGNWIRDEGIMRLGDWGIGGLVIGRIGGSGDPGGWEDWGIGGSGGSRGGKLGDQRDQGDWRMGG